MSTVTGPGEDTRSVPSPRSTLISPAASSCSAWSNACVAGGVSELGMNLLRVPWLASAGMASAGCRLSATQRASCCIMLSAGTSHTWPSCCCFRSASMLLRCELGGPRAVTVCLSHC